jgi:hypothetical protein
MRLVLLAGPVLLAACAAPVAPSEPSERPVPERYTPAAVAEDTAGCTHLATVQQNSCSTWQIYACEPGSPDRTIIEYDNGTPVATVHAVDGLHMEWTRFYRPDRRSDMIFLFDEPDRPLDLDPARKGSSMAYGGVLRETNLEGRYREFRTRNTYAATGETVTVSGRRLHVLEIRYEGERSRSSQQLKSVISGTRLYDPDLGAGIGFRSRTDSTGRDAPAGPYLRDYWPVSIALPGQPGFGVTEPVTECAK